MRLLLLLVLGICCVFSIDVDITINSQEPIAIVDKEFLSVTIDSHEIKNNFSNIQFHSKKLITLGKGLTSDVFLRFGGSTGDHIRFNSGNGKDYMLNKKELDSLCNFARTMGWTLVFGLNVLIRKPNHCWDPSNAIKLIKYLEKKNFRLHYELGNEPDLMPFYLNFTIPPKQLAEDFKTLHAILKDLTGGKSKLIGPNEGPFIGPGSYFEHFLSEVSKDNLDIVSFHHYYSSSKDISVQNFTNIAYLDSFLKHAMQALQVIRTYFPHKPVWIGETSSTYGHGSLIGKSFAATFLWLDKLGLSAQMNISVVARQTLKGPQYSLINDDYSPTPDYWASIVFKRIVGRRVLDITGRLQYGRKMRVYAHCVRKSFTRVHGKVVLVFLNVDSTESVSLRTPACHTQGSVTGFMYLFEPAHGHLADEQVRLNGKILKMVDDETLPELSPVSIPCPYHIPSLTYGFLLLDTDFDTSFKRLSTCDR